MKLDLKVNFKFDPKIFSKYKSLFIPLGILAVSLLLFIPLNIARKSLANNIQGSVKMGKQISSMLATAKSEMQWLEEKKYQDIHQQQADSIVRLSVQSTQRELLSYMIFPKPTTTSQQVFTDFGEAFKNGIKNLLRSVNALDAPTDAEVKQAVSRLTASRGRSGRSSIGGRRSDDSNKAIIDAFCIERAKSINVYVSTSAFPLYAYWENYQFQGVDRAVEDCWYSQIAYWIYEDVISTIKDMNSASKDVFNSPVKRLIAVTFSDFADYPTKKKTANIKLDTPDYVLDYKGNILSVAPWTGRKCDSDIDVVHFSFAVIIEPSMIDSFMKELCSEKVHQYRQGYRKDGKIEQGVHNQITILKYSHEPIDRESKEHQYYRYGDSAAVRLDLICEYIFVKKGYDKIKPEIIKKYLETKPLMPMY